jgi:hypothetical protein
MSMLHIHHIRRWGGLALIAAALLVAMNLSMRKEES